MIPDQDIFRILIPNPMPLGAMAQIYRLVRDARSPGKEPISRVGLGEDESENATLAYTRLYNAPQAAGTLTAAAITSAVTSPCAGRRIRRAGAGFARRPASDSSVACDAETGL